MGRGGEGAKRISYINNNNDDCASDRFLHATPLHPSASMLLTSTNILKHAAFFIAIYEYVDKTTQRLRSVVCQCASM